MRALIAVPAILALLLVLGSSVVASCRPPASVAENADRAVAVVHGIVTSAGHGTVTLRVDRVLKGGVGGTVDAYVGPGRSGDGGTAVATSIDYAAQVGSDHVLYLIKGEDGRLETNACIGSHAGAPSAEEVAHFGAGSSPEPASRTPAAEVQRDEATVPNGPDLVWRAFALVLIGAVLAFIVGVRVVRAR